MKLILEDGLEITICQDNDGNSFIPVPPEFIKDIAQEVEHEMVSKLIFVLENDPKLSQEHKEAIIRFRQKEKEQLNLET